MKIRKIYEDPRSYLETRTITKRFYTRARIFGTAEEVERGSGSCKPVVPVAYASDGTGRFALFSGNHEYYEWLIRGNFEHALHKSLERREISIDEILIIVQRDKCSRLVEKKKVK